MKYTAEIDSGNEICRVNVTGEFRRPMDSDELKRFAIEFSIEHGYRLFLINLTQAEVLSETMSTFEAANPRGAFANHLRKFRTAFVRKELTEDDRFYENVAVNRGFQLQAFDSVEKAVAWLVKWSIS